MESLFYELAPERSLDNLVLSEIQKITIKEIIEEQHQHRLLHRHNFRARNRVLIFGGQGSGKTLLAEALAFELMLPLIVPRYEMILDTSINKTMRRLNEVFDGVVCQRCVLLFDDFKTISSQDVANFILRRMKTLPDHVVSVVALTSDRLPSNAFLQRFQSKIGLNAPTKEQAINYIEALSLRYGVNFGLAPEEIVGELGLSSFSEIEEFCLGVARQALVNQTLYDAKAITRRKLNQHHYWSS